MQESMTDRKLLLALLAGFALGALVLASIGLYGVMAYAVANRQRELGVRLALGATRGEIVGDVLRRGLAMTGAGLLVGLPAAVAAGTLLAGQLYGVRSTDPVALAGAALAVTMVAILASVVPALRAAGLDPATALRNG
jgi:ABC-type antimicrobial peptide transport system permease subunit